MTWDAILGVHLDPLTCGVAKFNEELGKRLGIPVMPLGKTIAQSPLVSIHPREVGSWGWAATMRPLYVRRARYEMLLHSAPTTDAAWDVVRHAGAIYVGNPSLGAAVSQRVDRESTVIWAPSLLAAAKPSGIINVFLFGMAHKVARPSLTHLRDLLVSTGYPYTVRVSTAIHEGSPWESVWGENQRQLGQIFGDAFRPLGFLADELVQHELRAADAVALLYEPAARANNTTLWAAMDAGATVLTTLDADSPPELVHGQTCYDLARLQRWPLVLPRTLVQHAAEGRSWDKLIEQLTGVRV
jgi:hypothetical protein